jgi:2-dehydro-3-deoxyglucarate aldolase
MRVTTADDLRTVVGASRFQYEDDAGQRRFVRGCQANVWGRDPDGYLDRQDDTVLIGSITETAVAAGSPGEILDVPVLGFAFIGRRDLAVSLGHRNDVEHPEVAETLERVRTACPDAGGPGGRVPGAPSDARAATDAGLQLFLWGTNSTRAAPTSGAGSPS